MILLDTDHLSLLQVRDSRLPLPSKPVSKPPPRMRC